MKSTRPGRVLPNPNQTMTNPKTDQEIIQPTSAHRPASRSAIAAARLERQTAASATMIEACDRLAKKLDDVAGIVAEQIEAWHQTGEPVAPG
jgi:hypothetical protein